MPYLCKTLNPQSIRKKVMVKQILTAIGITSVFSSCTVFKSLNLSGNKQLAAAAAPTPPKENKFIEDITVTPKVESGKTTVRQETPINYSTKGPSVAESAIREENIPVVIPITDRFSLNSIESATTVQFKYAVLLNTEVESLPNKTLLEGVDEWYGVHYHVGGNSKNGVDCSGFTVAVYAAVYGITLPRVSRDQYYTSRKISTTELQEGDLVFFNTRGRGVSHVGIYLGNNHFIHASVSRGVMVSSLFEPYYLQRFVGAGRIDEKQITARK
jgi:lipoprotein Spr